MSKAALPQRDVLLLGLFVVVLGTHLVRGSGGRLGIAPVVITGALALAGQLGAL